MATDLERDYPGNSIGSIAYYEIGDMYDYYSGTESMYIDDILITWDSGVVQVPGDANNDGKVTIADFALLQNNFNQLQCSCKVLLFQ